MTRQNRKHNKHPPVVLCLISNTTNFNLSFCRTTTAAMSTAPNHHHQPSTSKPPKLSSTATFSQNPSSNPSTSKTTLPPPPITLSQENLVLSRASHLARPELLRRRSHNLRQLARCYKDHYWALMEELKTKYREYLWEYGVSPVKDPQHEEKTTERESGDNNNHVIVEGSGENVTSYNNANSRSGGAGAGGFLDLKNNNRCSFVGCKLKAMALTSFCHLHILSDSKQKLYKPCDYVIKSAQAGPITCGKPILRSTVPSLCNVHFQKAQKHVTRALKKAGLNVSSSSKLAPPKFHVIVAEYIRQIQAKRRNELKKSRNKVVVRDESAT